MLGIWILFFLFQRDRPSDVGQSDLVEEVEIEVTADEAEQYADDSGPMPRKVLMSIIWMGSVYFVFKFLRYALDSWSPLALVELFDLSEANAGYISTAFDWVGFVGVLFAGWASDKFFKGRRTQVILGMTVGMLLAFMFLGFFGTQSVWMFGIGLSLCGFMLMGPDSLLSGVGAIDVGGRRRAVMAAGIINGLGSIGPVFQEELIGYLLDHHGYDSVFITLVIASAVGVVGTGLLSLRSKRGRSTL
jgi:OPA family glycerol-3-phosphate transporter-like MFS transporter